MAVKEIVTTLKLDGKSFNKGFSNATAGLMKFSAVTTGTIAAVAALAHKTASYQDETIKLSRTVGTAVENFTGYAFAAKKSGVGIEVLTKSLAKLNAPTALISKTIKGLGIDLKNADGSMREQKDVLFDLADAFKDNLSEVERSAKAYELFGARGVTLVNLLKDGSAGLRENMEEARKLGIVFSENAGENAEAYIDSTTRLTASMKGLSMAIGETFIEASNQSGIIDSISFAVGDLANSWRNLDSDTKTFIATTISLVGGIGVAIGAITMLTLAAKALFAIMVANPIILIITAIIGAVILLANEIRKNWDQMDNVVESLSDSFRDFKNEIIEIVDDITSIANNIIDFGDGVKEAGKEVDILGTIAKSVFSIIATAIVLIINNIKGMISIAKIVGKTFYNLGDIIIGALTLDSDRISAGWDNLKKDVTKNISDIVNNSIDAGKKIAKIWSKPVVYKTDTKEIKSANEKLVDLKNKTEDVKKSASGIGESFQKQFASVLKTIQGFIGVAQTVTSQVSSIADSMAAGISRAADEMIIKMQVVNARAEKLYEETKEAMQQAHDDELEYLIGNYDAQIKALEDTENEKISIIENAALRRKLILDNEFQTEKARMEAEFEAYVENERAKFEAKKEILDEETADNEQRKIIDAIMEGDYNLWLESEKQRFEESITDLAKTYGDKRTGNDNAEKTKQELQARKTANKIAKLEKKKDNAITRTTEKFLKKMGRLDNAEEKRASKARRTQTRAEWERDLAVYNQTKAAKIGVTIATGAAAIGQAYAQSLAATAPLVPAGVAIASAITGLITASTIMQINVINKSKPRKPAELRMQSGGVLSGPSHASGGMNIEGEGGEGYLDVARTRKFLDIADNMANQFSGEPLGKVININFMERSLIVNDINAMIPEVVDLINRDLAEDVRRRVAV